MKPTGPTLCRDCGEAPQPVFRVDPDDLRKWVILRYEYDHKPSCPRHKHTLESPAP